MVTRQAIKEMLKYETVEGVRDFDSEIDHRPVYYPVADGVPMSDSQLGGAEIVRIMQTLADCYADVPDVYVWGNMFVYYEPRNPRAAVSPDVFVAIGATKEPERLVYFVWREGVPPTTVFEVASKSAFVKDQGYKRDVYQRMGVREYVRYDPHHEFMDPPLQVDQLEGGVYRSLEPDADGSFFSEALGLELRLVNRRLRFFNPETGEMLRSPAERTLDAERAAAEAQQAAADARQAADEAESRAAAEAAARRAAEARLAELEARLRERQGD